MQQDKKRKSVPIGKKDIELSLFAGDMILYAEKPKELTEKLVEVNRVARYKNM